MLHYGDMECTNNVGNGENDEEEDICFSNSLYFLLRPLTNNEIKERIRKILSKFVLGAEPDRLGDYLIEKNVITSNHWQRLIVDHPTKQDRCRALLHHLFTIPHQSAFLVVYQALSDEGHYLLESIDNQEPGCAARSQANEQISLQEISARQKLEKEREVWYREKEELIKKNQELQQSLGITETFLDVSQKSELEQAEGNSPKEQTAEHEQIDEHRDIRRWYPILEHTIIMNPGIMKKLKKFGLGLRRQSSTREAIFGFTILDTELYVASDESSKVEVYDSIEYSVSRRLNVKDLIDPVDIVACNRNKCLYIFDYKGEDRSKEILRVDPKGKLIRRWSTYNDDGFRLSVTDQSNVLFSVYNKSKLNEYSPDGQLIRDIDLSGADIHHLYHAIKLATGQYVVSHGDYGDDLHRVCLVSADGKLQKSFGGRPGSATGQMCVPFHLYVDKNGFVMVADLENSRVFLLNSDLEFKMEILSGHETKRIQSPQKILMDDAYGFVRLFVADSQKIFIFTLI